jgi:hypothetical protein
MKFVWRSDGYTKSEITPYTANFDLTFVGLADPTTKIGDFSHAIFSSAATI